MVTRPVNVIGDIRQRQAIHPQLFQDVYDWAGQLRTVDIRKSTNPAAEFFMPVSRLESGAGSRRGTRGRSSAARSGP
jgi:cell filamentation protein